MFNVDYKSRVEKLNWEERESPSRAMPASMRPIVPETSPETGTYRQNELEIANEVTPKGSTLKIEYS
jgi:hypothetical protein